MNYFVQVFKVIFFSKSDDYFLFASQLNIVDLTLRENNKNRQNKPNWYYCSYKAFINFS